MHSRTDTHASYASWTGQGGSVSLLPTRLTSWSDAYQTHVFATVFSHTFVSTSGPGTLPVGMYIKVDQISSLLCEGWCCPLLLCRSCLDAQAFSSHTPVTHLPLCQPSMRTSAVDTQRPPWKEPPAPGPVACHWSCFYQQSILCLLTPQLLHLPSPPQIS